MHHHRQNYKITDHPPPNYPQYRYMYRYLASLLQKCSDRVLQRGSCSKSARTECSSEDAASLLTADSMSRCYRLKWCWYLSFTGSFRPPLRCHVDFCRDGCVCRSMYVCTHRFARRMYVCYRSLLALLRGPLAVCWLRAPR